MRSEAATATVIGMSDIVDEVLHAYGGRARWERLSMIAAHHHLGGRLWAERGVARLVGAGETTVRVKDPRISLRPFGGSDLKAVCTSGRISLETVDDDLIEMQPQPRSSAGGHTVPTAWTELQAAHVACRMVWNSVAIPMNLIGTGVAVTPTGVWSHGAHRRRRLCVRRPPENDTHGCAQTIYLDDRGFVRRLDRALDDAGGARVAHLLDRFVTVDDVVLPTAGVVHALDRTGTLLRRTLVSIDLSDVRVR